MNSRSDNMASVQNNNMDSASAVCGDILLKFARVDEDTNAAPR